MALDVVAILTVAPGKEAEGEEVLTSLANAVKANESGDAVLRYKPYKQIGQDGSLKYIMIERYADQAALDAHRETDHYKAAIKKSTEESLLAGMEVILLEALPGGFDSR